MKGVDHSVKIDSNDIIFFAGLIILAIGLWIFNPALSLTISGIIFMIVGWFWEGGD